MCPKHLVSERKMNYSENDGDMKKNKEDSFEEPPKKFEHKNNGTPWIHTNINKWINWMVRNGVESSFKIPSHKILITEGERVTLQWSLQHLLNQVI